jgi:hypothetical protein
MLLDKIKLCMKPITKITAFLLVSFGIHQAVAQTDTAFRNQTKPLVDTPKQKILIQDSIGKTTPMPNSPLKNSNTEPMPVKPLAPTKPINPVQPNTNPPKKIGT